ncbi:MAG TPA: hypothetical protein VF662_06530 [Allosphingosinicella sp.]|jgi:hypothetical protein
MRSEAERVIKKLRSDRAAAQRFLRDPGAEWVAQGGPLPAGVSVAQFSQGVRGGPTYKDIEARANGQMSASWATPCTTTLVILFNAIGITGTVAAATIFTGGLAPAIAAIAGVSVSALRAILATFVQGSVVALAALICKGT